jgi:hypothetical protein
LNDQEILRTEFSPEFVKLMENRMVMSYYKYGPVAKNYSDDLHLEALPSMRKRLDEYAHTGNREMLVDCANWLMIEFMFPSHPNAHFKALEPNEAPAAVGLSVLEAEAFRHEHLDEY